MKSCETHKMSYQGGFVLISAMLFLVVLTILVISMMRTSILEERMISNARDWNVAFQAAESALRDAEREIIAATRISGETGFVSGCSASSGAKGAGLCLPNQCTDTAASGDCKPIWEDLEIKQSDTGWISGANSGKSIAYGGVTGAASLNVSGSESVAVLPRYIIEVLKIPNAASLKASQGQPEQKYIYRVTAVGFGKSTTTRVMLQGNYRQY